MRILVFGFSSQMGGVESFLLNYCHAMHAADSTLHFDLVVIDEIPSFIASLQKGGYGFHVVPNRLEHPIKYERTLDRIVREGNYDCLWYNTCTLSDITLLKKAAPHIPIRINHAHAAGAIGNPMNRALHSIHRTGLTKYATHFFACSEEGASFMFPEQVFASNLWHLIPNGISIARYKRNTRSTQAAKKMFGLGLVPVFGHVGRFSKEKNHAFLLKVFAQIRSSLPDAVLLLIGNGHEEEAVHKLARTLDIEDAIRFLGARQDVPALLKAMDVFLFPSEREGFGLALLEAQATGLECLASTGVPKEAILTPRVHHLPLDKAAWTTKSLAAYERSQKESNDLCEMVKDAGYDINANAERFIDFLSSELARHNQLNSGTRQ